MIFQCYPATFMQQLLQGVHHFDTDVMKIALYQSSIANLGTTTTAYTANGEITSTGYTAGGLALTSTGTAYMGTTGYCNFAPATWTGSGIVADGALIYNSTAVGNPAVLVLNFGMTRVSDASGNFTVGFPTNNSSSALIRINGPNI